MTDLPPARPASSSAGPPAPSAADPHGLRPTALVGGLILTLFIGSQLLNASIPASAVGDGAGQVGGVVHIGRVSLRLAPGWQSEVGPAGTRLAKGSVAVDIATESYAGDAWMLYDDFVEQALAPQAMSFGATAPVLVEVGPGLPAAHGAYNGIFGQAGEVEGELTVFVTGGAGYVFDAWGGPGSLSHLGPEVEIMIRTIQVAE